MKQCLVFFGLLFCMYLPSKAQTTSWKGTTNTNWSIASNWTNGVPNASVAVIIGDANFTGSFQPRVNAIGTCKSLTLASTVPATLTLTRNLTVNGDVNIGSGATMIHPGSNLFLTGSWSNSGTYSAIATTSRVIFNGTTQSVGGNNETVFRRVAISAGSTLTLNQHMTVDSTSCLLDVSGTINPGQSPAYTLTSKGTNKINPTARLLIYTPTFSGNYVFTGATTFYAGSVAEYASAVNNQVVSSSYSYSTLVISGGTTKTLSANLPALYGKNTANGIINVQAGIFDLGTYTANRATTVSGGQLIVASGASLRLSGTSNFPLNFLTRTLDVASNVEYYGATQTISAQSYGNLVISGTGTKNALTASTIRGNLVINSSALNTSATVVSHSIAGDIIMNGGSITGTAATYVLNGTSAQSLTMLGSIPSLTVNKASGSVSLNSDLTINNTLTFTKGNIVTGANRVILESGSSVSGASQSTGWVEGYMKRHVATGTSVSRSFAVGSASYYAPVSVQFATVSSAGYAEASTYDNDHSELDYSGIDDAKSVNRYWLLSNLSVGFTSASATFNWETSNMDAGSNTTIFRSGLYNGSAWTILSASSPLSNSVVANNITSFGEFAVGEKLGRSTWTGNNMTSNWFTPKNWHGGVPASDMDALIPDGLTGGRLYPILTGSTGVVKDVNVEANASLVINAGTLQIGGAITNAGTLSATDGTVEFNGSSAQTIPADVFNGNKIMNLIVSNDLSLAGTDSITGTLSIAQGKTLYTNNNLVLKSTAAGTARIAELPVDGSGNATAYINGDVSIERFIPARKAWRLLSAPISNGLSVSINQAWQESSTNQSFGPGDPNPGYGVHITGGTVANGFDQSPTNSPSLKIYNSASNSFVGLPATPGTNAPIGNYTGYMIYIRGDRSIDLNQGNNAAVTQTTLRVKGTPNTGSKTYTVNATGFTVLGNPYASAINFQTLSKTNVKNTFYIWDPKLAGSNGLGAYVTASWNSGTNQYDFTASASPVSQYIPSGEAVLIQSNDGVSAGSITVQESDKTSLGSDAMFGRGMKTGGRMELNLMEAEQSALLDAALITFNDRHANAVDHEDAFKLPIDNEKIAIARGRSELAIERRKLAVSGDSIMLSLSNLTKKSYRLEIRAQEICRNGISAYIIDRYQSAGVKTPLATDGATMVEFTVNEDPASSASDRFVIVFNQEDILPVIQPVNPVIVQQTGETSGRPALHIYPNPVAGSNLQFNIEHVPGGQYQARVINLSGQVVYQARVSVMDEKGRKQMIVLPEMPAGQYNLVLEGNGIKLSAGMLKL